jgi:hypothetical protein
MKSLKEFQKSEIGKSLSINEMVNIKGGYAAPAATGASAQGGECVSIPGLGSGCATWTSDSVNNGVETYTGFRWSSGGGC